MSHLTSEVLWDAAKSPTAEQSAHLASCAECKVKLEQVKLAQAQLLPTPVPPLPNAAARRIGLRLEEAAQRELVKKGFAWWPFSFSPNWALAAVAAALLAVLAARLMAPAPIIVPPEPVARHEVTPPAPIAMPTPVPAPAPTPAPAPPPKPQLAAAVTSARKASSGSFELNAKTELKAGDTVATAKGGELWMRLPDGSRAGLTPSSKLSIGSLTEDELNLELDEGSVLLVAKHLPQRELKVTVGELEVRDIGTRFVVSRDLSRAVVAVEEGVVEVKAPSETRQVKAGHLVRWQEGQLTEETWTPPEAKAKKAVKTPAANDTPPIPAEQPKTEVEVVPPAGTAPSPASDAVKEPRKETAQPDGSREEEWAQMPPAEKAATEPAVQGKAVPATGGAPDAAVVAEKTPPPKAKVEEEDDNDSPPGPIDLIKMGINLGVRTGKRLLGKSPRENEVRAIGSLADKGDCEEVLRRAEAWLDADPTDAAEEPAWHRAVRVNQMRCLRNLHRDTEADAIKRELSGQK